MHADSRLPSSDFADLADAVFVASQHQAIRADALKRALADGAGGRVVRELAETEAHGARLAELFALVYALAPFEAAVRAALGAILEGRAPATSGRPGIPASPG